MTSSNVYIIDAVSYHDSLQYLGGAVTLQLYLERLALSHRFLRLCQGLANVIIGLSSKPSHDSENK